MQKFKGFTPKSGPSRPKQGQARDLQLEKTSRKVRRDLRNVDLSVTACGASSILSWLLSCHLLHCDFLVPPVVAVVPVVIASVLVVAVVVGIFFSRSRHGVWSIPVLWKVCFCVAKKIKKPLCLVPLVESFAPAKVCHCSCSYPKKPLSGNTAVAPNSFLSRF